MEITINDLKNLMNGGIIAMREGLNYKQIICEEIEKLQNRVKKEFEEFKNEIDKMSIDDVIFWNYKIYTYCNLNLFFTENDPEQIYDELIIKLLEEDVTKNQIDQFFLIDNILYQLYDHDLNYDLGSQTRSYEDIVNLIIDFCEDF